MEAPSEKVPESLLPSEAALRGWSVENEAPAASRMRFDDEGLYLGIPPFGRFASPSKGRVRPVTSISGLVGVISSPSRAA